ncbi:hypothetical protein [Penaeicola halotolerans]|uniref:hypothetical protein n=1 Tax=Penaeicola halotolerans TaxID=2793196 RepID=UPI001CF82E08|nr:hypothetical protein [Penaeicola halotolerans]
MENKIDQLFKEKLGQLDKAPAPVAWDQLERKLAKKNQKKGIIWWQMVAAGLVLLLGAKWAFDSNDALLKNVPDTQVIAEDQGLSQLALPTVEKEPMPTVQEVVTTEKKQAPVQNVQQEKVTSEKVDKQKTPIVEKVGERSLIAEVVVDTNPISSKPVINIEEPAFKEPETTAVTIKIVNSGINQTTARSEDTEVKKSLLGKVITIGKEIAEIDDAIGDIREAKNQFFSKNKDSK